jgi:hypothetical protein
MTPVVCRRTLRTARAGIAVSGREVWEQRRRFISSCFWNAYRSNVRSGYRNESRRQYLTK